jgi:hypothetical protein
MIKKCRFCGSTENVSRVKKRFYVCSVHRPAVYAVINHPDVIEEVWPMLKDRAILPAVRRLKIPWRSELPEELDATRHRTQDRDHNDWYLIVSEYMKRPVELFVTTAGDNNHKLQGQISNLTALTRLISLMLRHVFLGENITIGKIKSQLKRSSRQAQDLPDMVLSVLNSYKE